MIDLFLSKKEKLASTTLGELFSTLLPAQGGSIDFGSLLTQLRGESPADPLLHKGMAWLGVLAQNGSMYHVVVKIVLDALEARGVPREGVASLAGKLAKFVGADLSGQQGDAAIASLLSQVASNVAGRESDYMGALVVCPKCNFTQIV